MKGIKIFNITKGLDDEGKGSLIELRSFENAEIDDVKFLDVHVDVIKASLVRNLVIKNTEFIYEKGAKEENH